MLRRRILSVALAVGLICSLVSIKMPASAAEVEEDYKALVQLCLESEYVDSVQVRLHNSDMVVAGESIPINLDQEGVTPQLINQRTLLPAQALAKILGGSIDYKDGVVHIQASDDTKIELEAGNPIMHVDGKEVKLDSPPVIIKNQIFLPVRAISENLGCDVTWDRKKNEVTITRPCQTCRLVVCSDKKLPDTNPARTFNLGYGNYVLVYDTVIQTESALKQLKNTGITAWPDTPVEVSLQGSASTSWEDQHCGLTQFSQLQSGSRPVTVAVLDSGLDPSLPVFQNRIFGGLNMVDPDTGRMTDKFGHGTQVTSLIARYTPQQVKIIPIKLFNDQGLITWQYSSIFIFAFQYARLKGADIINASFVIRSDNPVSQQLCEQVRLLSRNGVAVVCSAGNNHEDTSLYAPANVKEAIVVGATDQNNLPTDFSNYGETVDLSAPGISIQAFSPGGGQTSVKGTSFSTSLVSAVGAVLLTQEDLPPAALEEALKKLTKPMPFSTQGKYYGNGVLYTKGPETEPEPTPTLTGYRYNVGDISLKEGETTEIKVTALYSDGSTKDVTTSAKLSSTNPDVATVNSSGTVTAVKEGTAQISMGTISKDIPIPTPITVKVERGTAPTLTGYRYNVGDISLKEGETTEIKVTALYSDGSTTKDVTKSAKLYSTNPDVATVNSSGTVTAVKEGTARISIGMVVPSHISIPSPITVTVIPSETPTVEKVHIPAISSRIQLKPGETAKVPVLVTPGSASSLVVWRSSNSSVATVAQDGTVTAQGIGDCQITASVGGKSASCIVRVQESGTDDFSVQILSSPNQLTLGETGTFRLNIKTPLPYKAGGYTLTLYCAVYVPGQGWVECKSLYYDGGDLVYDYELDPAKYGVPSGRSTVAFSLYYPDQFYSGSSTFDTIIAQIDIKDP